MFRNGVDREKWVVEICQWSPNTDSCTQEPSANGGVGVIDKRAGTQVYRGDTDRKKFQLALHQEEKGEKNTSTSVLAAVMHS